MIRLASILLLVIALVAFDALDAARGGSGAASAAPDEIRFDGAVMAPAGIRSDADARSIASLPPGRVIRRGTADSDGHDPLRTVVMLPSHESGPPVVVITYD